MHPIERLRWIAGATGEADVSLASEAAWTMGELAADDPAAVLTASRRLVGHHPACGPLWWVCARLSESAEPLREAEALVEELLGDTTAARLAEALRREVPRSGLLSCAIPAGVVQGAIARRGGYILRLVGDHRALSRELSSFSAVAGEVVGYRAEEADAAVEDTSVLLVEPCFASEDGLVLGNAAAAAVRAANEHHVPIWALLPTGRVLGRELAASALSLAFEQVVLVPAAALARAVSPAGSSSLAEALSAGRGPRGLDLARTLT